MLVHQCDQCGALERFVKTAKGAKVKDPWEVLKQKEAELEAARKDVSALYRVAPLLAEAKDAAEMPKMKVEMP